MYKVSVIGQISLKILLLENLLCYYFGGDFLGTPWEEPP